MQKRNAAPVAPNRLAPPSQGLSENDPPAARRLWTAGGLVVVAVIAAVVAVMAIAARPTGPAVASPTPSSTALPFPESIRVPTDLMAQRSGLTLAVQSPASVTTAIIGQSTAETVARHWPGLTASTTIFGTVLVKATGMGGPYTAPHLFWAVSVTPDIAGSNYGVVFVDAETGVAYTFSEGYDPNLAPVPGAMATPSQRAVPLTPPASPGASAPFAGA